MRTNNDVPTVQLSPEHPRSCLLAFSVPAIARVLHDLVQLLEDRKHSPCMASVLFICPKQTHDNNSKRVPVLLTTCCCVS